jgi:hypothetical protein
MILIAKRGSRYIVTLLCLIVDLSFGASIWTTQEWKIFLASGDISDSDNTREDDGKPRTHTKPSKCKTKWSASKAHRQIRFSLRMLRGRKKAEPFRTQTPSTGLSQSS